MNSLLNEIIEAIKIGLNRGIKKFKVYFSDGSRKILRLTRNSLGEIYTLRTARGGWRKFDPEGIVKVEPIEEPQGVTKLLKELRRFIKCWQGAHNNVWRCTKEKVLSIDLQEIDTYCFAIMDVQKVRLFVKDRYRFVGNSFLHWLDIKRNKVYLKSLYPKKGLKDYTECLANISRHLDNNEIFCYRWETAMHKVEVYSQYDENEGLMSYIHLRSQRYDWYYALLNEKVAVIM